MRREGVQDVDKSLGLSTDQALCSPGEFPAKILFLPKNLSAGPPQSVREVLILLNFKREGVAV